MRELVDRDPDPDVVEVDLEARVANVEIEPGHTVELWTYDGSMPGPLLRAKVGDLVRVHFKNSLPEATTVHWHGLEVPADMDGAEHNQGPIEPGDSFEYAFRVPHAGTYWFHPHLNSSAQLWRGLYAPLVVEDPEEPALGAEALLVLDDILFAADGSLASSESNGNLGDFFGREGNVLLVNGHKLPSIEARPGQALRLRLINASNSRYLKLQIPGLSFARVGGDSGLIERPEPRTDVTLVPGERAELVVVPQGEVGSVLSLHAVPYDRFECGGGCSTDTELLHIRLVEGTGHAPVLPASLREIAPLDLSGATEQKLSFTQGTVDGNAVLGFNNKVYPDALVLAARVGETQIWTIENTTDYDHPFHLHGFRFQVLDQAGRAPSLREWKDTLNVPAHAKARFAAAFDDRPGMWMFHCHILDHAKIGMMGMLHLER